MSSNPLLPTSDDEDPRRAPRHEGVTFADGSPVVRRQTRPIGEFGGNLGGLFWTLSIPILIWYFYGLVSLRGGALAVPNGNFTTELIWGLPEGIAIRPTWKGLFMVMLFIVLQALLEILVPGKILEGVVQKNGRKLEYPMNGLASFIITHIVLYTCVYLGFIEPQFAWRNMGALLTGAVITSFAISLWIYIDWGIFWKRHVDDKEFEEDWGVFSYREVFSDFWLGVARNPRCFRCLERFGKPALDLKRFFNARPGLTGWVVLNQSYVAAIYLGCHLEEVSGEPVCSATGDFSRIGFAAIFVTLAHWYYIFDYNYNEPAYLTTTDIRHDLYGFMLAYGCVGFLSCYYPIAFLGHIAGQATPLNNNPVQCGILLALYLVGMVLFRVTNIEKHRFRSYIAEGGDLSQYKVWGKPVTYIRTKEGSYLLTSGTWGLARHFNYIGDLVMCIGWAVGCSGPGHVFPWVPTSYCLYFWIMDLHRLWRDEERCARKYGQDWLDYKKRVPYFILPGIF